MTTFPPDWQGHHDSQLVGFGTPTFADADIVTICCIKVNPDCRLADSIRISLSGTVLLCTRLTSPPSSTSRLLTTTTCSNMTSPSSVLRSRSLPEPPFLARLELEL